MRFKFMSKKREKFSLIFILLVGGYVLSLIYFNMPSVNEFLNSTWSTNLYGVFIFYILGQFLKFVRLQFLLLEKERNIRYLFGLFSLSTISASLVPFKIGEFIKIYLFKNHFKSWQLGFVTVLVERFFDILILLFLISIITYKGDASDASLKTLMILFIAITTVLLFSFLAYPKASEYLTYLTISASHSERGLSFLKALSKIDKFYDLLTSLLRGRWQIVSILTCGIWIFEVLSVYSWFYSSGKSLSESGKFMVMKLTSFLNNTNVANDFLFILILIEGVPALIYLVFILKGLFLNLFKYQVSRPYQLRGVEYVEY